MTLKFLSRQEELLLLVILRLKDNAYGVTVRETISMMTNKYWSIGAIYDILDRLVRKGYVNTEIGDTSDKRGGKRKRFYKITEDGFSALEEVKNLNNTMWADLPGAAYKEG